MSTTRAARRRQEREEARLSAILARIPAPVDAEPGRVNIWFCPECQRPTIARDVHQGVTPMLLGCRADLDAYDDRGVRITEDTCTAQATSVGYRLPPASAAPADIVALLVNPPWEWFVPSTTAELHGLMPEMVDHLVAGGLDLRKRPGATGIAPSGLDPVEDAQQPTRWERFWKGLGSR